MKKLAAVCAVNMLLLGATGALAAIDLSSTGYQYDIPASILGGYDITSISFDYNYGGEIPAGQAAFRIRRLNGDGTDSWLGSFNIHAGSFNLDTDYGPYSNPNTAGDLSGTHHYEFTLNRANGLWDLRLDGNLVSFWALDQTNDVQPNGDLTPEGASTPNKFFSDESLDSGLNAIALGWATLDGGSLVGNASSGVGGTGAYRLVFNTFGTDGAYVDNIEVDVIPEPAALIIWTVLAAMGVAFGYRRCVK